MKIIALFNNKGGVGTTTIVFHLAHMFSLLNYMTIAVDLDPQSNLTSMFFDEEILEPLLENTELGQSVYSCIQPIMEGVGDILDPQLISAAGNLYILCGDLRLSLFEDKLSDAWQRTYEQDPSALRTTSAFYRIIIKAVKSLKAEIVLMDVGPNLGAINRTALLCADFIVVPLAADLFSLQGLENLGPTIGKWRENWMTVKNLNKRSKIELPPGKMHPIGYIILQHFIRLDRPVKSYEKWLTRIPDEYYNSVLNKEKPDISLENDPNCLSMLRHYRSLIPMAQESRKPIFNLKPADGAIGSHGSLVRTAYNEFKSLAEKIIEKIV